MTDGATPIVVKGFTVHISEVAVSEVTWHTV
jgi:hypothetical protein